MNTDEHGSGRPGWLLVAALLTCLTCDKPPQAYTPEPDIWCVLKTNEPGSLVMAGMSITVGDTLTDPYMWNGVQGVTGVIRSRRGETHIREMRYSTIDTAGFYTADSFRFAPGDTCDLDLQYPGGQKVHGETFVPESCAASILAVDTTRAEYMPGDTEMTIRVAISIPHTAGAYGYRLRPRACYRKAADSLILDNGSWPSPRETDTVYFSPFALKYEQNPPETLGLTDARVFIMSVDRNFADFYPEDNQRRPLMRLNGALGVFGSMAVTELKVGF